MKILALEPYYGGSHHAFLDGWSAASHHDWTVLGLPAHKWKWRMRHSAVTLAEQARATLANGQACDLVFCSDMLNLAEFRGLAGHALAALPAVVYFHENQLTYPVRADEERDFHFGMTNFITALAAEQVWFNSAFHRDSFLTALEELLGRMPDYNCRDSIRLIRSRSSVLAQGVDPMPPRPERRHGPPRILWAARWEHDKNPDLFFEALFRLKEDGVAFRLDVIGEQFATTPPIFDEARRRLGETVKRWGYQESRDEYVRALLDADILVSTADHEFFGVSVVEAVAAGAFPLLPDRLAYPEIFNAEAVENPNDFFYDGSLEHLTARLRELLDRTDGGKLWGDDPLRGRRAVERFTWPVLASQLDEALDRVVLPVG